MSERYNYKRADYKQAASKEWVFKLSLLKLPRLVFRLTVDPIELCKNSIHLLLLWDNLGPCWNPRVWLWLWLTSAASKAHTLKKNWQSLSQSPSRSCWFRKGPQQIFLKVLHEALHGLIIRKFKVWSLSEPTLPQRRFTHGCTRKFTIYL